MTTNRQFVYSRLQDPAILAFVGDRTFLQGSLLSAQIAKPFVVYTMGNNTDEGMSDPDTFMPSRQFFQVYVHDELGDYARLDDLIQVVKEVFLGPPYAIGVCGVQYLETSRDLTDDALKTSMRYVRFQLATSR